MGKEGKTKANAPIAARLSSRIDSFFMAFLFERVIHSILYEYLFHQFIALLRGRYQRRIGREGEQRDGGLRFHPFRIVTHSGSSFHGELAVYHSSVFFSIQTMSVVSICSSL